jgi:hypothetical protein
MPLEALDTPRRIPRQSRASPLWSQSSSGGCKAGRRLTASSCSPTFLQKAREPEPGAKEQRKKLRATTESRCLQINTGWPSGDAPPSLVTLLSLLVLFRSRILLYGTNIYQSFVFLSVFCRFCLRVCLRPRSLLHQSLVHTHTYNNIRQTAHIFGSSDESRVGRVSVEPPIAAQIVQARQTSGTVSLRADQGLAMASLGMASGLLSLLPFAGLVSASQWTVTSYIVDVPTTSTYTYYDFDSTYTYAVSSPSFHVVRAHIANTGADAEQRRQLTSTFP